MTDSSLISTRALTARDLEDFGVCPRKFLLAATASRDETQGLLGGPAMLTRAVRNTLHEALAPGSAGTVAEALARFEAHFEGRYCADSREEDELADLGRRVLREVLSASAERDVLATNVLYEGEIDGERFQASADLLLRTDSGLELVRFTLSRKAPTPAELGQNPGTVILHDLATPAHPGEAITIVIEALRAGARVVASLGDGRLEATREALLRRARTLRAASEFGAVKGSHCRWCRSQRRCPEWRR